MSMPLAMLSRIDTVYNKPSPPPYLGAVMPFLFFLIQKPFLFKQKLRCQQKFGTQATDPIFAKHTALFLPHATVDLWPLQKIRHI